LYCLLHRQLIWYSLPLKHLRQDLRLPLQAVEHRDLSVRHPFLVDRADPLCQILRFLEWIIMILYRDPAHFRPASLDAAAELQKPVGRFENRGIGPVVHRQRQLLRPKPMLEQEEHILAGAPPAVDHLVRIAHSENLRRSFLPPAVPERSQKIKLQHITVLHLVHDDPCRTPNLSRFSVRGPFLRLPPRLNTSSCHFPPDEQLCAYPKEIRERHFILSLLLFLQERIEAEQIVLISALCLP